jgi:hypothetical protein
MTVSRHVYSAHLLTSPEIELSVRGGRISLDAGQAPHVRGDIDIAMPDAATCAAIDPRAGVRVRVEADGEYPSFSVHREFDLTLRDRDVQHREGIVSLVLGSDEALLQDFSPLADDTAPRALESSLRAVVNYVLGTVIPGAALEASPAHDADITRYWELTNRVYNPSAETTTSYALGGNAAALGTGTSSAYHGGAYVRWESVAAGLTSLTLSADGEYTAGEPITATAHMRANGTSATGQLLIRFFNSNGDTLADSTSAPLALSTGTAWTKVTHTAVGPRGSVGARLIILATASSAAQVFAVDGVMFHDGDEAVPFFTGSSMMPGATGYTVAWNGTTSNSASTRTPYPIERDKDSLTWSAGQSALDFLAPLVQAAGLRLVCDEQRRWTLRDEEYTAPGSLSIRHGVNMIDGQDLITRDSGLWYDAAVARYTWTDRWGRERVRLDSYALTGTPALTRFFEFDTPYPGPGFAQYAVRRAQQRGREVTATAVADWRALAEMPATITLEGAPILTGNAQSIAFDLDRDEMTVTQRATDTPDLAWILGPSDLAWADVDPALTWAATDEWSDL